ncbi:MAG TPA: hypothetical protein VNR39_01755 [Pseudolabrys sp.]|nr:hypothetical protein [Pseudolabrys sp.]
MTMLNLPPLCPVCGGQTRLREIFPAPRGDGFSCFFRCVSCRTDYPRKVSAADVQAAGFRKAPAVDNGERDPAA